MYHSAVTQLPFDPDQAVGADPPAEPQRDHLTVSEVSALIKSTLERHLPPTLRVIGQVSNLSRRNHWFFSLKDENAVLGCVAWASAARGFSFVPQDGVEVIATGHLDHYAPQGRTQFYVSHLTPVGAGAMELQFRALCAELRGLGYFDEARKKRLPLLPRRIAVITSAGSAALQDVIATAASRCRAVGLVLVDVRVQGDGAAEEVAAAIRRVDTDHAALGVDAVLVTRGGGSVEDLWAFNERLVADAAFACRLPLVAAIGHESDTTIVELVADVRAATPTQAIMRLIPAAAQLQEQVAHLEHRLRFLVARLVELARQRLRTVERFALFRDPGAAARLAAERLAVEEDRLRRAMTQRVDQRAVLRRGHERLGRAVVVEVRRLRDHLDGVGRQLESIDPHRVLTRGYSWTTTPEGRIVRCVGDVRPGREIRTRVTDGTIDSVVARSAGPAKRRAPRPDASEMDLFGRMK